jgi:hypothetical protein
MSTHPASKEDQLADKIAQLSDASNRPRIDNGGFVGDIFNFASARVPVLMIRTAIIIFIVYYAWIDYQRAQQLSSEVGTKTAEAARAEVEADGLTRKFGDDTVQGAKLKAELEKLEADARSAEVDAKAAAQMVDGGPARLRELQAEMEQARAEAAKAEAEVNAQNLVISGLPLVVQQKKAEIDSAEAEAQAALNNTRFTMGAFISGNIATYAMNAVSPSIFGGQGRSQINPYTIKDIFFELHGRK